MRRIALLLICFISSFTPAQEPIVVGYFPFWSVYSYNFHIQDVRAERLTHLIYQYANLTAEGLVIPGDSYVDINNTYEGDGEQNRTIRGSYGQLLRIKEQHPELKTIISIGGWVWSEHFSTIAADAKLRQNFAQSTARYLELYGFDGVEIDWRFPTTGGDAKTKTHANDQANFTLLIKALAAEIAALEYRSQREYQILLLSSALPNINGLADFSAINEYIDYFTLASATLNGSWSPLAAHQSPLYPHDDGVDSAVALSNNIPELIRRGMPANKTVLVIPGTGIGWEGVKFIDNGLHQRWKNTPFGSRDDQNETPSGIFNYQQILELLELPLSERIWDETGQGTYLYNHERQLFISYEDDQSINAKLDFAASLGLAGAGLSDLAGDTIDNRSQLHSLHRYYFPWQARIWLWRDVLLDNITLVSSIISAFVAILVVLIIWWRWYRRQLRLQKQIIHLSQNKFELIQQLGLSRTIAELISLFFEKHQQRLTPYLSADAHQQLLTWQRDQHVIFHLGQHFKQHNQVQLRPREINLNSILLVINEQAIEQLQSNTWLMADPRALLAIWRFILKCDTWYCDYQGDEFAVHLRLDANHQLELTQMLAHWQTQWLLNDGEICIIWSLCQPQSSLLILQHQHASAEQPQRLNLLQQIQRKTLLTTDIESHLQEVLEHLSQDDLVAHASLNDISDAEHQLILNASDHAIHLKLHSAPSAADKEFFDCIGQLLQLSRIYVSQLAKQPQLLSELYEISSRIEKLKYIKAEKGYSGIYELGKKSPRYVVMRLRAIKLYFEDQYLVQVHRSWLVNPNKVSHVVRKSKISYVLIIQDEEIPIGRSYFDQLLSDHPSWFEHPRAR